MRLEDNEEDVRDEAEIDSDYDEDEEDEGVDDEEDDDDDEDDEQPDNGKQAKRAKNLRQVRENAKKKFKPAMSKRKPTKIEFEQETNRSTNRKKETITSFSKNNKKLSF